MIPILPVDITVSGQVSSGETALFWVLAPAMVLVALGLLFAKKAVYAAVSVVFVMVCLAFMYTALEAPFLGVVQVIVYTGAIMMLFLFVLMLVGVDSSDSLVETLKGQRWLALLGGLGLALVLGGVVANAATPRPVGLDLANAESNPVGVAKAIFGDHVLTMELTGALLITAALGAMVLTHREKIREPRTQLAEAEAKMRAYAEAGIHPGAKPNSGVYAESNSAANPALTAGGQPAEESVSRILRIRGQARTVGEISPTTVARIAGASADGLGVDGPETFGSISQVGLPGMPGKARVSAPTQDEAGDLIPELSSGRGSDDERQGEELAPTSGEQSGNESAGTIDSEDKENRS